MIFLFQNRPLHFTMSHLFQIVAVLWLRSKGVASFTAVASLVGEAQGYMGFCSCGSCGLGCSAARDLPKSGIKLVSPALTGGFLGLIFFNFVDQSFPGLSIGALSGWFLRAGLAYYFVFAFFLSAHFLLLQDVPGSSCILYTAGGACTMVQPLWKICLAIPQNTKYRVTM